MASKGTLLLRDLAVTVTPSSGALVSSKTLPLRVVLSTTEMSDVGAAVGLAESEALAVGLAVGLVEAEALAVGLAVGVGEVVSVGVGVATGVGVAEGAGAEALAVGELVGVPGVVGVLVGEQAARTEKEAAAITPRDRKRCLDIESGTLSKFKHWINYV